MLHPSTVVPHDILIGSEARMHDPRLLALVQSWQGRYIVENRAWDGNDGYLGVAPLSQVNGWKTFVHTIYIYIYGIYPFFGGDYMSVYIYMYIYILYIVYIYIYIYMYVCVMYGL